MGVKRDIPAKNALETGPDIADDRSRANDYPANHPETLNDSISRHLERRGGQRMCLAHRAKHIQWEFTAEKKPNLDKSPKAGADSRARYLALASWSAAVFSAGFGSGDSLTA